MRRQARAMAKTYTVDASVFLNGFNPYEAGHEQSNRMLAGMQAEAVPIIVPTLLLPEVAAAVSRGRDDTDLARGFAAALRRLPHLVVIPLDETLADQAADLVAQYRLRSSDAVYAAVALRFGSTLVTLDQEQRERVADVLPTRLPVEALREWG
jgi:predicted nucleic acid-binding protein